MKIACDTFFCCPCSEFCPYCRSVFTGRKVTVVKQAFAHKILPESEPLGQKVDFALYDSYLAHPPSQKTASVP